jgi:type II secretory pathway pseudopilin PulG
MEILIIIILAVLLIVAFSKSGKNKNRFRRKKLRLQILTGNQSAQNRDFKPQFRQKIFTGQNPEIKSRFF